MSEENLQETAIEETTSQETEELDLDLELESEGEQEKGESSEPDTEALKAELAKVKEHNAKLYARLKKTEVKKPAEAVKHSTNSGLTREEAILFAKGYTEEEVDLANRLAKVNGTNPLVAAEDSYFKAKVQARLKKEQSAKAALGASNGSSKFVPKDVGSMPREEHIKLFHEVMSKI